MSARLLLIAVIVAPSLRCTRLDRRRSAVESTSHRPVARFHTPGCPCEMPIEARRGPLLRDLPWREVHLQYLHCEGVTFLRHGGMPASFAIWPKVASGASTSLIHCERRKIRPSRSRVRHPFQSSHPEIAA